MLRSCFHLITPCIPFVRFTSGSNRRMSVHLPHIPSCSHLTPLILRITGGNPSKFTLQGTNTYLLGKGPERLLIDTGQGFPVWAKTIRDVLEAENASINTVLLTHHHHDHTAGLKDVPGKSSDVEVWKHPALPSSDMYREMLKQSIADWGGEIKSIEDGMTFDIPGVKGVTLRTVHTPGHTLDHCAFILEKVQGVDEIDVPPILFTGDAVLGHGTAVFEDLATYIDSLHKMYDSTSQLKSESGKIQAYPAHGQIIEDAAGKLQEYIAHRAQREREVIETLDGHRNNASKSQSIGMLPMDIVKIMYKDYPEPLHAPAESGLRLILEKLKGEDKAAEQNGRWTLVDVPCNENVKAGL